MSVYEKQQTTGQHQTVHRGVFVRTFAQAEHLINVVQMNIVCAVGAANHGIGIALAHHHCADERQATAHLDFGKCLRYASTLRKAVILL